MKRLLGFMLAPLLVGAGTVDGKGSMLSRQELERAIREEIGSAPELAAVLAEGRMEVTVINMGKGLSLPADYDLQIVLPKRERLAGRITVKAQIFDHQVLVKQAWITALVQAYGKVLFTRREIAKGGSFGPQDVYAKLMDLDHLPEGFLTDTSQVIGMQAKRHMAADMVLALSSLTRATMARKGSVVSLLIRQGPLQVRCRGVLIEDGYENQAVRVQNFDSKKIVLGRMITPSAVLVEM